jgi:hypothetical protein
VSPRFDEPHIALVPYPAQLREELSRDQRQPVAVTAYDPVEALVDLTRKLEYLGVAARIVAPLCRPPLVRATSPHAPEFSEHVTCEPGAGGDLCFCWSWGGVIALATDCGRAADSLRRVLGV